MSFREQPVANRLCTAAWRKRDAESHAERVRNPPASKAVDHQAPKTYFLNISRAKKEQVHDELCDKIDRENQLLLKKMTEIVNSHTLDVVHPSYKRSLNMEKRQRDFNRIVAENNAILQRITLRKAHYDREDWTRHREKHDLYLENCRRDKPIPANPIPLPKFLRDGMPERQPHAYITGNYSPRRGGTQQLPQQNETTSSPATASPSSYSSGSQSARAASSPYTPYKPFSPNRTGTSKTGSAARVHTLQPMPPPKGNSTARTPARSTASSSHANASTPATAAATSAAPASSTATSTSALGVPTVHSSLAAQAALVGGGYSHILTNSRSLGGDIYATLSVHETPSASGWSASEEKQEESAPASGPSSCKYLSSALVAPAGVHALVFRSYDPLENLDRSVSVPFATVATLSEVRAKPHLLAAAERVELATTLIDRLDFHGGELRFSLGESPQDRPDDDHHDTTVSFEPVAAATAIPTPATHPIAYTDAHGTNYYFDASNNTYLPFPAETHPAAATSSDASSQ